MATICSGRIIQVFQNDVVFVLFRKKLQVSASLNHYVLVNVLFEKSLYKFARDMLVLYLRLQAKIVLNFNFFQSNFEKVLSYTASFKSLGTIVLCDFNVRSSVFWTRENTITEEMQLESLTTVPGFHQLISQPTYLLPQNSF